MELLFISNYLKQFYFPQDEEQISQILKLANQEKFNVVPRGSGTGLSGGSIPVENSVVIVMTKME